MLQLAPPAGAFGMEDLPLMMLRQLQLGPKPHGTLKIHNSAHLTGFCKHLLFIVFLKVTQGQQT